MLCTLSAFGKGVPMNESKKLSDVLRSKRYQHQHTQEQAAELLDISTRWLQEIESGKGEPGFKTICRLAKEYNIDFAQFVEEDIV